MERKNTSWKRMFLPKGNISSVFRFHIPRRFALLTQIHESAPFNPYTGDGVPSPSYGEDHGFFLANQR